MIAPAVHAVSLLQFAPFLAESGIDTLEFFRRRGLAPNVFQRHDDWIPRNLCLALSNALALDTGNPFAGAFLGSRVSILDFGELGRRLGKAETVHTCCSTAIRNLDLVHQGSQIKARIEQGSYILRFSLEGNLAHDPRQFILATLAVLRNVILLAEEPEMVKVRLSLPYDRRCSAIEACLGEQLEFGCDYDEIEIRTELLDKPLSVSRNVGRIDHAIDTSVNAAVLISERLSRLPISIDCISAELGLTRRTLQRRLSECGLAFSDLVDVTRRDIAMQRLLTGNGSLKQLSFDLGYSDQAHFTRTFKRWMGTVPSEYRTLNRGRER